MALRILLADDSVPAQNMGKKILVDAGYDVLTVGNGLEALRKIADNAPDLAILDIFMPGYTGLEICERLRANAATASLPVILTVGKLEPYRPEDGEKARSNAVIVKPFASVELTAAVRSLIGDQRAVSAAASAPVSVAPAAPPEDPEPPMVEARLDAIAPAPADEVAESLAFNHLRFNPDAGRTPFRASIADVLPANLALEEEDWAPEKAPAKAPANAEFALEANPTEATLDPAADADSDPAMDSVPAVELEPAASGQWQAEPVAVEDGAAEPEASHSAAAPDSAAEAETAAHEIDAVAAEASDAVQEAAAGGGFELSPDADGVPQDIHAQDEVGRRQAFEALFNSEIPFPIEEEPAPVGGAAQDAAYHSAAPAPTGPEAAALAASGGAEPFAGGPPPEDAPRAGWTPNAGAQQVCQIPDASPSRMPELAAADPHFYLQPAARMPEIPQQGAASSQAAPAVYSAALERSELMAEVAKVEALLLQMQAIRQSSLAAEMDLSAPPYTARAAATAVIAPEEAPLAAPESETGVAPEGGSREAVLHATEPQTEAEAGAAETAETVEVAQSLRHDTLVEANEAEVAGEAAQEMAMPAALPQPANDPEPGSAEPGSAELQSAELQPCETVPEAYSPEPADAEPAQPEVVEAEVVQPEPEEPAELAEPAGVMAETAFETPLDEILDAAPFASSAPDEVITPVVIMTEGQLAVAEESLSAVEPCLEMETVAMETATSEAWSPGLECGSAETEPAEVAEPGIAEPELQSEPCVVELPQLPLAEIPLPQIQLSQAQLSPDEPAAEVEPGNEAANAAERVRLAVEQVFDRFRPLLVAAIVRELARRE